MDGRWNRRRLTGVLVLLWILGMTGVFGQRGLMGSVQEAYQAAEAEVSIQTDTKESRRLALTFDDGPHPYYTELLLDGLAERRVKATFFLLGANIEGREDVVKRMAEEGHLIGNHTYYHVDINSLTEAEACREITETGRLIAEITGQPVEYIRPPYGNWNKSLECDVIMLPVFWSLDTLDWKLKNTEQIVKKVLGEVEENDVILMHDSYATSVEAALRIVDELKAQGYEFVTVEELILE
ncbi:MULTISPECIES: polysaccharide deacetylase family protein [Lachnospiraceae]